MFHMYARRVGKRSNTSNRKIIIRLHSFSDKNEVLRCCQNTTYVFVNFDTEPNYLMKDSIEKVHTAYMKKTLNVTKFASNMCMYSELRRFPILHNAWSLAIKYWLRLCTGTGNILLNNAYRLAMEENHMWVQSIQYLLSSNGLGDIWICPENANAQFHKLFRLRLNDQFIQRWYNFINTSSRFVTLRELSDDFKLPVYINVIKNPSIRPLFTRLRIDINVLSTSRGSQKRKDLCPLCSVEAEDVSHFILRCHEFATERDRFLSNASVYMSNNELSTDASKLNVILNLRCPPECIPLCCEYVNTIYKKRECSLIWVDYDLLLWPSYIHVYCMWIIILLKVLINHILHETRFIVVPCHRIFHVLLLCMCVFRYFCFYVVGKIYFYVKLCQ